MLPPLILHCGVYSPVVNEVVISSVVVDVVEISVGSSLCTVE